MTIILQRFGSTPFGTFGRIVIDGKTYFTLERQWSNNEPGVSCVPLGSYTLHWQPTTTPVPDSYDGYTWYLDGESVSRNHASEKPRTRIAVHIGNTQKDIRGCIAVGRSLSMIGKEWAISSSNAALTDLLEAIGPGNHQLMIIDGAMG